MMGFHCPLDTGFEIRACYLSVPGVPRDIAYGIKARDAQCIYANPTFLLFKSRVVIFPSIDTAK